MRDFFHMDHMFHMTRVFLSQFSPTFCQNYLITVPKPNFRSNLNPDPNISLLLFFFPSERATKLNHQVKQLNPSTDHHWLCIHLLIVSRPRLHHPDPNPTHFNLNLTQTDLGFISSLSPNIVFIIQTLTRVYPISISIRPESTSPLSLYNPFQSQLNPNQTHFDATWSVLILPLLSSISVDITEFSSYRKDQQRLNSLKNILLLLCLDVGSGGDGSTRNWVEVLKVGSTKVLDPEGGLFGVVRIWCILYGS